MRIDEHEAYTLAEMLGAARIQERIDAGLTIGELELRRRTGVTIIAVIWCCWRRYATANR